MLGGAGIRARARDAANSKRGTGLRAGAGGGGAIDPVTAVTTDASGLVKTLDDGAFTEQALGAGAGSWVVEFGKGGASHTRSARNH